MRENRLSGSEGGGAETNQSFLPLSGHTQNFDGHPDVARRRQIKLQAVIAYKAR